MSGSELRLLQGLIFDFNGTLLDDGDLHVRIWTALIAEHFPGRFTSEQVPRLIRGRANRDIVSTLLNRSATPAEVEAIAGVKERRYREAFAAAGLSLAPGVAAFLDGQRPLRPLALATMAPDANVALYRDLLGIDRWFTTGRVFYDDGSFAAKPAPDIFLKAAAALGLEPADCTVFGDAPADITAAQAAGIGQILQVDLTGTAPLLPGADACLRGFADLKPA